MALDPLPPAPHLLEVAHVAHRLSVGEAFVRRLIRQGHLVAIRLGGRYRIDERDYRAFVEAQRAAHANGQGTTAG